MPEDGIRRMHLSDTTALLVEMTGRLLSDLGERAPVVEADDFDTGGWDALAGQGLTLALAQGDHGFGIELEEGLALVRLLGEHGVTLPVGEAMMANALLTRAGVPPVDGVVALVPETGEITVEPKGDACRISGIAKRVPWGRRAAALLVEGSDGLALMTSHFEVIGKGGNMAGVPRDTIYIDGDAVFIPRSGFSLLEAGALLRVLLLAGALKTLLSMTVSHVSERVQFGRPLSKFQAVQHALARLAGETAAADAATALATGAFAEERPGFAIAIGAARSRISDATAGACAIAHQLHGAIGFTQEHPLHRFTSLLWSWRDEFGSASYWTRKTGMAALGLDKAGYWPMITAV